ncbi:MAG: hypothetical protein CVU64_14195 [Deltaproteobacteria bacterium HGW-Deltaproteobacteria-21]|nr:MAG: hypothetical protein CVU64_14195 [Deltaproteobacteria bacterium HGW-Deltaproteobacteria-21]
MREFRTEEAGYGLTRINTEKAGVAEQLGELGKDELMRLIDLMRRRGMGISITDGDIRLVRYEQLCNEAHERTEAALKRMAESHDAQDSEGWNAALGDFDKAMRLYELADEVLCRRPVENGRPLLFDQGRNDEVQRI